MQNQFELFLTKDSLYQLEIPEFVWDGTFYNADSRAKENRRFEGAVNGNYVPDGVYSLLVELINSSENNANGGIVGADTQKYTIIVDKSAPKFNIALKTVCDDFARSKYSFLIYSEKNENLKGKTENNDETAVLWQIFYLSKSSGNENPEMIHVQGNEEALLSGDFDASKKGRLLPYQFSATDRSFFARSCPMTYWSRNSLISLGFCSLLIFLGAVFSVFCPETSFR